MSEVHEIKFFEKDGELLIALFAEPSILFPEFWIKNIEATELGFSTLPKSVKLQRKYKIKELNVKPFESNKEGLAYGVSDFLYRLTKGSSKENHTYITKNITHNYEQNGNFGIGQMSGGNINDGARVAGVINEAEQQNLIPAVEAIQTLLEQLRQTNPTNTTKEKMDVAAEAIDQIEKNPDWKKRIVNAAKKGGLAGIETGIKKATDSVIASTMTGIIKGWLE